jgi:hypothetical protein
MFDQRKWKFISKKQKKLEEKESKWGELSQDCLIDIFIRLSVEDQWRGAMLVCKSWFSAFKEEPSLHSVFNLDPYFPKPLELPMTIQFESPRWWTLQFESKIDSMLRSIIQWTHIFLTQIRIQHCSDRSLTLVAQRYQLSSKQEYEVFDSTILF